MGIKGEMVAVGRIVILVVDDSPDFRNLLREALELAGYRVLEARNGQEGTRLFRNLRPNLVLLDMLMPEKDGIETFRDIIEADLQAQVITLSGNAGAGDHNGAAKALGVVGSLERPFLVEELYGGCQRPLELRLALRSCLISGTTSVGGARGDHTDFGSNKEGWRRLSGCRRTVPACLLKPVRRGASVEVDSLRRRATNASLRLGPRDS